MSAFGERLGGYVPEFSQRLPLLQDRIGYPGDQGYDQLLDVRAHVTGRQHTADVAQVLPEVLLTFQGEDLADLAAAEQVLLAAAQQVQQGTPAADMPLRVCVVEERFVRERNTAAVVAH